MSLYELARAEGVALLTLRPLARIGRGGALAMGSEAAEAEELDECDLLRLRTVVELLDGDQQRGPGVRTDIAFVRGQPPATFTGTSTSMVR